MAFTVGMSGAGGSNADTVDGFHASQTPGANIIVPLNADGVLDLSATSALIDVYTIRRINGDNLSSDYSLAVGEEAVYNWDTTASLSKPLRIATVEGFYLLIIEAPYQTALDIGCNLNPNNTTYTNAFNLSLVGCEDGVSSLGGGSRTSSMFSLEQATSGGMTVVYLNTFTSGKSLISIQRITRYTHGGAVHLFGSRWNDTTTAWTSLGTLTTTSANGIVKVLVRRLA